MSHPRKLDGTRDELGPVLERLPLPIAEPTSAEWELQFSRTMQRLEGLPRSMRPVDVALAGSDSAQLLDEVLRAPLPMGADELDHAQLPLQLASTKPKKADNARGSQAKSRSWYWAGTIGTLAAAAAAALWFRQGAPSDVVAPLQSDDAKGAVVAAAVAEVPRATPSDDATSPKTEDLPLEPPSVARPTNAVVSRGHAKAAAARPSMPAKELPEPAMPEEPTLTPAAGPSNLNDHPANGEVFTALSRRMPSARQCLTPASPSTAVRVTFQSSGTVQKVDVLNSAIDAGARRCLKNALAEARVTPFARSQFEVTTTVSFSTGSQPAPGVEN